MNDPSALASSPESVTFDHSVPSRPTAGRSHSMIVPKAVAPVGVSGAEALADMLVELGVEHAFGVFGGGIAPFCEALSRSPIRLMHFRHEAGAAFAAIESSLASGKLTVVLATTGPGLTNLYTGMVAARAEGAKVLFVSGCTSAAQRGRMAFQETHAYAAGAGLFEQGQIFHYAAVLEDAAELEVVAARLATGTARPSGFVAHLGLPLTTQTGRLSKAVPARLRTSRPPSCDISQARACAEALSREPFVIWAGFGARHAAPAIRELASRSGARVMCTPRGKGIVPETDPLYLGVTGLGGHAAVEQQLQREQPQRALVLGSRLSEMSSFWRQSLVPERGLIHVDLDPEVFGAAYPQAETWGIQSEIGAFVEALLEAWPEHKPPPRPKSVRASHPPTPGPRSTGSVRPSFLMSRIQRLIVEGTDSVVLTEAGNAFALGSHYLQFMDPNRYRVSTSFGSMGQAAAGVLGAALAHRGKAFAILGDGAMLMQNEINTAATYGVDAVWIILNDARYGMIAQGMESIGWTPFETDFPRANFVSIARGMGGDGVRVQRESQVDAALERAILAKGPFVVDITIDETEQAPAIGRNQSLVKQGVNGARG